MESVLTKRGWILVVTNIAYKHRMWVLTSLVGALYVLALYPQSSAEPSKYILAARSLAEGKEFSSSHFPPGFPLLLAPVWRLLPDFPGNLWAMQLVPLLFGILSVPVIHVLLGRHTDLKGGLVTLVVLLYAISPLLVLHSAQLILTETPYLFFSLMALLLLQEHANSDRRSILPLCGAALSMAASYYVRVVGVVLVGAGILYLLGRKKWQGALLVLVLFALLLAPWMIRNHSLGLSPLMGDYGGEFSQKVFERPEMGMIGPGDLVVRVWSNIWAHATNTILWALLPAAINGAASAWLSFIGLGQLSWVLPGIGLLLACVIVVGFLQSLSKRRRFFDLYVVLYVSSVLLSPWYAERNLVPILPFLLHYLVLGIQWLSSQLARGRQYADLAPKALAIVALSVLCLGFVASDRHALAKAAAYRAGRLRETDSVFLQLVDWVRNNTHESDVIMYRLAGELYLYTGRKSIPVPEIPDPTSHLAEVHDAGVNYVVLEPNRGGYKWGRQDQHYLQPTIARYPDFFEAVHEIGLSPRIVVYKVQ